MAISIKLLPIVPVDEGYDGCAIHEYPVASAQTIRKGDILVIGAGGQVSLCPGTLANVATDNNAIIGIAAEAKASVATPATTDVVRVYPALPGRVFEGHMVSVATTDISASVGAILGADHEYVLATDSGSTTVYCIAATGTATLAAIGVIGWANGQIHDQTYNRTGILSVTATATTYAGVTNPRVKFVFKTSFLSGAAAA